MLTKLIDVCSINKYPQLDASGLEDLRTSTGNIKLLPSSKDYDWVSNYETSKDYLCDGEVITLGKARYANIKYYKGLFVSANNVIVESKNQNIVLTKFLYYYCLKNNKNFYVEGTTYPKFDMPSFSNSMVDVPSISEQKNIIGSLDTILHLIENEEKQLKLYDELIKSRFIEMFGDPEFNPFAFEIKEFSKLGNLARGKSKHRPRNDAALLGGPYPLIQTGDVSNADLYIKKYSSTYSELGLKQSKMWAKGTLCITIAANIAESAILDFDACFPDSVVGFEPNEEFNVLFVKYHLDDLKSYLDRQATSVAQKNLNLEKLSSSPFMAPPIELQNEFASFVEQIDKSKFINYSRYFLWEFLTLFSSTIAYSSVVSILA